jgi:hypothetical protein
MHPGGAAVLLDKDVAGKDSTEAFFSMHRSEVLQKYARYQIGSIRDEKPSIILPKIGALSPVPHGEPMWLQPNLVRSPYYKEAHYALQKAARQFFDEHVAPEAHAHELSGKRPSVELVKKMGELRINVR